MIVKKCRGCGITLQTENPGKAGYVIEEKFISEENLFCQRCFKIKNYGQYQEAFLGREEYSKEVKNAVNKSDIILAVFDIIDFEGSFSDEILDFLREKSCIVVINKIDLLPSSMHPSEISDWVKLRLEEEDIVPYDIALISTETKYGVNGVLRKVKSFKKDANAVVMGVTNVGKSSFINTLTKNDRATISKYPGTTLKSMKNSIVGTEITLIDTPGLIPEKRISDFLESKEALKLVPNSEISRKTFKLENEQVFMFDGLVWFKVLKEEEELRPIFSAYASKELKFHVTREERVKELTEKGFFNFPSQKEKKEYYSMPFVSEVIEINANEELAISGLGWINVKRGPVKIEITCPEDVKIVLRKGLINPKNRSRNEEKDGESQS